MNVTKQVKALKSRHPIRGHFHLFQISKIILNYTAFPVNFITYPPRRLAVL